MTKRKETELLAKFKKANKERREIIAKNNGYKNAADLLKKLTNVKIIKKESILNKLVEQEAKNLVKFATKEELNNLDFKTLDGDSANHCIYGKLSKNCFSIRAVELIEESCERVYENNYTNSLGSSTIPLNGSPKETNRSYYWSPIEVFIAILKNQKNGNNEKLINYLKGKTNKFNFK